MNPESSERYARLQAFCFDRLDAQFPFSGRLARDNGWSLDYAQRVIEEYKRFTFLAVEAEHPVTPSDQVDQVWHLHLTYSRSYWEEFCPQVLGMVLHHEPTRGGDSEREKFEDWYGQTLESYERFFEQVPPSDIWPDGAIRFGRDVQFVRVNRQQHWILPKFPWPEFSLSWGVGTIGLGLMLTGCSTIEGLPNPFNFNGSEFLQFYGIVSASAFLIALIWQKLLLRPNLSQNLDALTLDAYEVAYLVDERRLNDLAIISLVQKGYVKVNVDNQELTIEKTADETTHLIEKSLIEALPEIKNRSQITSAIVGFLPAIQKRLQDDRLLMDEIQTQSVLRYPMMLLTTVLALGILRVSLGLLREKPVGYLIGNCLALVCFSYIWIWYPVEQIRRMPNGDRLLKKLRRENPLKTNAEMDSDSFLMAVALFGMDALPESLKADLGWLLSPAFMFGGDYVSSGPYDGGYYNDSLSGGDFGGCGDSGGGCGGCGG